jgi:hypothetical protein
MDGHLESIIIVMIIINKWKSVTGPLDF